MKLRDEIEVAFGLNIRDDFYDKLHDKLGLDELMGESEVMMNTKTDTLGDVVYQRVLPNGYFADKIKITIEDLVADDGFEIEFNQNSNEYVKYGMGNINGFVNDEYGTYNLYGTNTGRFWVDYVTKEEKNKAALENRQCIPSYKSETIDVSNQHDQMLDFAVSIAKNGTEAIKNMTNVLNASQEYKAVQQK